MYKVRTIILLCTILVGAKGDVGGISILSYDNNIANRTDNYINLNRLQYAKTIEGCDTKLNTFKEHYAGRVDGVNVQLNMLTGSIVQIEERLNPLEVLSDFSNQCVIKYRSSIPTVAVTKTSMTRCTTDATNQINNLVNSPLSTRNSLQNYYTNYFEKEITNCGKNYDNRTSNYTACITTVTANTNIYTISNQKTFNIQMDAAECTAKANIKRALDCSYTIQTSTISKITEADVRINNCLAGKDECKSCDERNSCPVSYDFKVDYKNKTMSNPFYGLEGHTDCLLLKLY